MGITMWIGSRVCEGVELGFEGPDRQSRGCKRGSHGVGGISSEGTFRNSKAR
jgi:hypothetical protein